MNTEDRFGRAGKANVPEDSGPAKQDRTSNWSELEPLYKLDEHAYDLKLDFNISLEDWTNFSSAVDRMFALLSNDNQPDPLRRPLASEESGRRGGGHALVSSTSQSASAIYLTTLATPALLLKEAGAGVLREALGLNQNPRPSSASPSSSPSATSSSSSSSPAPTTPPEEEKGVWGASSRLLDRFLEENKNTLPGEEEEEDDEDEDNKVEGGSEEEEEVPLRRRKGRWRFRPSLCDCSEFLKDSRGEGPI